MQASLIHIFSSKLLFLSMDRSCWCHCRASGLHSYLFSSESNGSLFSISGWIPPRLMMLIKGCGSNFGCGYLVNASHPISPSLVLVRNPKTLLGCQQLISEQNRFQESSEKTICFRWAGGRQSQDERGGGGMCGCEGGGVGMEWGRVEAEVGGRVEGGRAPRGEGGPD